MSIDRGLDEAEAAARLRAVGPNRLRAPRRTPALAVLVNQLRSPLVLLLCGAAALSFAIGEALEGGAIAAAIGLSIALGFATELRAVRSMEALRALGAVRARVRRGGVEHAIPATELVPGDVALFEGGDRVTADIRIVEASKLQADESALTGESVPVGKHAAAVPRGAPLADRTNMLYKGATVTRGSGAGVVVATGMATELGHIAELVDAAADDETTPLERRLAALGQRLMWVCLAIAALTTCAGILGGRGALLMIETGVALAVAAIPEGLPVVATIALARGMRRLAARHALIKKLSAVETLGATSVIVADKTGTLTENRMTVVALVTDAFELSADELARAAADPTARRALELAALCNNAALDGEDGSGDPLEVALLRAAAAAGIRRAALLADRPELREEAFDPETKMMATAHRDGDDVLVAVKGAPEAVLAVSAHDDTARAAWHERGEQLAARGLRVLALAHKTAAGPDVDVYAGLRVVALVGLADPPRRDVAAPIAACRRAGIRVVMATGDQPATALSIARAVGLTDRDPPVVIHGAELDDHRDRLVDADVFARVTPEQKLDIIAAHQRAGAVVAMTGDGVNDAPALRKAEIGVAMGLRGTDVAREAAAMVLKDDSFESIAVAVEQGRAIFENIRRFVVYLLSCNVAEILIVAGAVVAGAALPLLPLQILFLNLVTDVFPALALGFSAGDPHAMDRPPRDAAEPIVARTQWLAIVGYAALLTAAVLAAMAIVHAHTGGSDPHATTASFLTLGFAQLWHVFNMRRRGSSLRRCDIVRNPWVWGAVALCTALLAAAAFFPQLARVLRVVELDAWSWSIVLVMSAAPTLLTQIILAFPSPPSGAGVAYSIATSRR